MRGRVSMEADELSTEAGADDLFSKLVMGCTGTIKINTPFGDYEYKKNNKGKVALTKRLGKAIEIGRL